MNANSDPASKGQCSPKHRLPSVRQREQDAKLD